MIKCNPLKVKARFKLQKGKEGSAFCSLGINTSPDKSPGKVKKPSPQKASPPVKGKGINSKKRKRSLPEESPVQEEDRDNVDLIVEVVPVEEIAPKRGRKAPAVTASKATTTSGGRKKVANNNNNNNSKIEITKRPTKASKRKSLEQEKQEREDFELAKKLQKEFNSSSEGDLLNNNNITNGGVTRRMTRNSSVATSYSLRTTRSLSKVSLGSEEVHPVGDGEREVEDAEEEIQTTKKTKKSPPRTTTSKAKKTNGLNSTRTRNTRTVARKTSPMDEKDEVAKSVSKNKETSNRRTTRSKGSHGSAK